MSRTDQHVPWWVNHGEYKPREAGVELPVTLMKYGRWGIHRLTPRMAGERDQYRQDRRRVRHEGRAEIRRQTWREDVEPSPVEERMLRMFQDRGAWEDVLDFLYPGGIDCTCGCRNH